MDYAIAQQIIREEVDQQQEMAERMGFRIEIITEEGNEKTPFMACTYYQPSLTDIHVKVYEHPLTTMAERCPYEMFRPRFEAGLREELIHSIHLHLVRSKFDGMTCGEQAKYDSPYGLLKAMNRTIVDDLSKTEAGTEFMLLSARLYYENSDLHTLRDVANRDADLHSWVGYSVSETIRQTAELRSGHLLAEEAKQELWDQYRYFGPKKMLPVLANRFRHLAKTVTHPLLEEMVGNIHTQINHAHQPALMYTPVVRAPRYSVIQPVYSGGPSVEEDLDYLPGM